MWVFSVNRFVDQWGYQESSTGELGQFNCVILIGSIIHCHKTLLLLLTFFSPSISLLRSGPIVEGKDGEVKVLMDTTRLLSSLPKSTPKVPRSKGTSERRFVTPLSRTFYSVPF